MKRSIGYSSRKKPIFLSCHGSGSRNILLLGGVHGDEPEGVFLAERYEKAIQDGMIQIGVDVRLYICTTLNPDGYSMNRRTNDHNVDLNRNLPTKDWKPEFDNVRYYPGSSALSEPESKITVKIIQKLCPLLILSLHSYHKAMVNYNGPCKEIAEKMSRKNNLPVTVDIGYPVPGSLGTYAGWERKIPTITLEILRGQDEKEIWETHHQGLTEVLSCL